MGSSSSVNLHRLITIFSYTCLCQEGYSALIPGPKGEGCQQPRLETGQEGIKVIVGAGMDLHIQRGSTNNTVSFGSLEENITTEMAARKDDIKTLRDMIDVEQNRAVEALSEETRAREAAIRGVESDLIQEADQRKAADTELEQSLNETLELAYQHTDVLAGVVDRVNVSLNNLLGKHDVLTTIVGENEASLQKAIADEASRAKVRPAVIHSRRHPLSSYPRKCT